MFVAIYQKIWSLAYCGAFAVAFKCSSFSLYRAFTSRITRWDDVIPSPAFDAPKRRIKSNIQRAFW